jgi:CheY-like chemotaxis protein
MPTVFLVEDNAADVELFRMALQEAQVECDLVLFEDGRRIIDHIREADATLLGSVPDLIMLDLNLPKNNGLEILHVMRDTQVFAAVSIVVLSSSSSPRERAKLAAFNIREFIVKPADLEQYLNIGKIVRRLLEEARSPRATE